ncbi:MAG: class I SAM-dependent methyltransferase [Rhodospirillaceae bacterium]|nr:class I SAM-dependent methyltransferase [Rhodospirillaceae bacterium]MYH35198.1 class I SAM-dependent methyltransferase [Rhodospirillaceae bacterium]MYK12790.1 class I SAM-dependent methyltransferase [Rhodospirillaceae bacterium]MYK59406.1 class I SAM-dependent methyltransferase [Rhodospirillaceae bacterium]
MLLARLMDKCLPAGRLTIVDAAGARHVAGQQAEGAADVTVRIHDRAAQRRLLLNPKLAFGELYMDGRLTIEDGTLYDFLDLLCSAVGAFETDTLIGRFGGACSRLTRRFRQYNPVGKAQRNVAHHYDLSGRLYDLFLDKDKQYSCAYFNDETDSLEDAQHNKKRHIAAKLLLESDQKVLDIGCGWGGLALYLAREAGVEVTGLTLSREQHGAAEERARKAGLDNQVRFRLQDYREERETYDRIVSVGMFEHVGATHYREFFGKLRSLLKEDGVALLHTIGRAGPPGATNAWLAKYIFPGGYTPALSEMMAAIEKENLWVTDIEALRLHYAGTLRHWRERFAANRDEILDLYDERFCRMWEFYLTGCELSFRRMDQLVFQIQIARRRDAVPLTRGYIERWEDLHRGETVSAAA